MKSGKTEQAGHGRRRSGFGKFRECQGRKIVQQFWYHGICGPGTFAEVSGVSGRAAWGLAFQGELPMGTWPGQGRLSGKAKQLSGGRGGL